MSLEQRDLDSLCFVIWKDLNTVFHLLFAPISSLIYCLPDRCLATNASPVKVAELLEIFARRPQAGQLTVQVVFGACKFSYLMTTPTRNPELRGTS